MGLFVRDDIDYNESVRMTGFNRYKQLLSFYAGHWTILNLIMTLGALPLIFGITFSILCRSTLLMIPLSFLGGMVWGPFLASLFDSIQRGLRDDCGYRWHNFKKALKQNLKCSLIPGGICGLIIGSYCFMFYMMYCSTTTPTTGTIAIILFSFVLFWIFFILYWTQLVLFHQTFFIRIRNIILFTAKYLWKMLLISIIAMALISFIVLFAPLTLIIVPFIGVWYPLFLSQFLIYDALNTELHIEELHEAAFTESHDVQTDLSN